MYTILWSEKVILKFSEIYVLYVLENELQEIKSDNWQMKQKQEELNEELQNEIKDLKA